MTVGLIAFCGFVLPWGAIALWLYFATGTRDDTSVPWRPLTDYAAPGDMRHVEAPSSTNDGALPTAASSSSDSDVAPLH